MGLAFFVPVCLAVIYRYNVATAIGHAYVSIKFYCELICD
ncbi:hypothetical protein AOT82_545 [Psychrobacter sp. AntiMn-1]|nr:hypothetical protein AOT82_545 [Psychrobacter sp. AntiMn-1]